MKVLRSQFVAGAALLVGVAIGFVAGERSSDAPVSEESAKGYVPKAAVADRGDGASLKALRSRIAELEKALAEKTETAQAAISNAVAEAVRQTGHNGRPPRGNPREWMENLKKNDPARYAQMTNRFARWRQRRMERTRNTMDFLSSIDTSHMSAGAKKTHDELQQLIAQREEIEDQLHQDGISDDERRQLMDQMRETDRQMRRLNQQERSNLIEETAKSLGFDGEAVQEISSTLQEVIEATGGNGHGGFDPPPPGGGAPGGAGGGAPGGAGGGAPGGAGGR